LRFIFPDKTHVSAFGFEFRASEEWRLMIDDIAIALPKGRAGFIGILMYWGAPTQFTLTSLNKAQGGLAVDNISYVSSPLP
jgi:hypothetical protein